jgi:hypothetical protein
MFGGEKAGSRHELEQVNQPCSQPLVLELGLLVIILHSTSNEAVAGVSNDVQLLARGTRGRSLSSGVWGGATATTEWCKM